MPKATSYNVEMMEKVAMTFCQFDNGHDSW